jgi:cytoskeletal protein CcmA (bactofilin family)
LQNGEKVTLAKDQVHKGSLYATGENITINGTVEGDLYCAGKDITITGTVAGGVACAGENITFTGEVKQSARFAAAKVEVNEGVIAGDLTMFAATARVKQAATVKGDLNGAAQLLEFDGTVERSMLYAAAIGAISGAVQKDVNFSSDTLKLGEKARIGGELQYRASEELQNADAVTEGAVSYSQPESAKPADVLMALLQVVAMIAFMGLMLALFAPRFMERSSVIAGMSLAKTVLAGVAVLFFTPLAILLLFLTGIGATLAIVVTLLYIAIILLSGVFFAYYLGAVLLRMTPNILVRMIGGTVVLGALWMIPIVNIFVMIATVFMGTGIVVRALLYGYRPPKYQVGETPDSPQTIDTPPNVPLETPRPIAKKPKIKTAPKKPSDDK